MRRRTIGVSGVPPLVVAIPQEYLGFHRPFGADAASAGISVCPVSVCQVHDPASSSAGTRVVRLFGQLGNQLFQFALGRTLTPEGEPVPVEHSSGDLSVLAHAVEDGAFRLMTQREALSLRRAPMIGPRRKVQTLLDVQKLGPIRAMLDRRIYFDPAWGRFDPSYALQSPPVLYQGYFQREEYFMHDADRVVAELRPVSEQARALFSTAAAPADGRAVVSIHLRAGADYAQLGWNPRFGWFRTAAEAMATRLGSVGFVVASDIPLAAEAVAAALRDLGPATPLPGSSPYDAMRALSLADRAITSPSSFSWWAAWLGDHRVDFDPDRVVIAPSFWLVPGMQPAPQRWTLLDAPQ